MDWTLEAVLRADVSDLQRGLRSASGWLRQTGKEVDDLTQKLNRLDRQQVEVDLSLKGDKQAERQLDDLAKTAARLDAASPSLRVDLDGAKAVRAEIAAMEADLDERFQVRVVADTSDLKAASAEVAALDARADKVDGKVRMDRSDLRNATTDLQTLKKLAMGVAIGGAATTAAAGGLTVGGLMAADDMTQTRIAFEGLLQDGELAVALMDDLKASAAKTPFEISGLATSVQQLLGMGRAVDQVIPDMETIGGVAAALGRGEDDINGVVIALGQMASKGKVSAEELNQISERLPGFNARAAIAASRGTSVAQSMEDMEKGLVASDEGVEAILAGMAKFPGAAEAMAKQSETLSGKVSTFMDETKFALADAFTPLEDSAKESIDRASAIVGDKLPDLAVSAGNLMEPLADVMLDLAGPGADGLSALFDGMGAGIENAKPALNDMADLLPEIGETIGDLAEVGIPAFVEAVHLVSPVISPGTMVLRAFLKVVDSLPGPLQGAALGLGVLAKAGGPGGAGSALKWLSGTGAGTFGGGLATLATRTENLANKGGAAFDRFGAAGTRAGKAVGAAGLKTGGALRAFGQIPGAGLLAVGGIAVVAKAWDSYSEEANRAAEATKAAAKSIESGLQSGDLTALDVYGDVFDSQKIEGLFGPEFGAALERAGYTRTEMFDTLISGTEADIQRMSDAIGDSEDKMDGKIESFFQGVGRFGSLGTFVNQVVNKEGRAEDAFAAINEGVDRHLEELANQSRTAAVVIAEIKADLGGDPASIEVFEEINRQIAEGTIQLDERRGVIRGSAEDTAALAEAAGVSAQQIREMNAAEKEALETETTLAGIRAAGEEAYAQTVGALVANTDAQATYFAVLADGQVTQAEATRLMEEYGLTAESAEEALANTSQAMADTIQMLAEQAPTMGDAIGKLQMDADNFSIQNVLDEMHRMTEDLLAERDRTTMLLAAGYDDLVAQVQTIAPEHRGAAVRQLLEMTPEQLQAAEERLQTDAARLGQSAGVLMSNDFAAALTLADPVLAQAALISATMEAVANNVPTPVMRMNADPSLTAMQAVSLTMDELALKRAEPVVDVQTGQARQNIWDINYQLASLPPSVRIPIYVDTFQNAISDAASAITAGFRSNAKGGVEKGRGDGLYRWAEAETGAELLVPQRGITKDRALDLLGIGAAWHGASVVPNFAAGGIMEDQPGWDWQTMGVGGTAPDIAALFPNGLIGDFNTDGAITDSEWAQEMQRRAQLAADAGTQAYGQGLDDMGPAGEAGGRAGVQAFTDGIDSALAEWIANGGDLGGWVTNPGLLPGESEYDWTSRVPYEQRVSVTGGRLSSRPSPSAEGWNGYPGLLPGESEYNWTARVPYDVRVAYTSGKKFHAGGIIPGSGEKPLIGMGGEGVFTREQMRSLAPINTQPVTNRDSGITAPVTVEVNVSSSTSPGDIAAVVSRTLRAPETERQMVQAVSRAVR